MSGLMNNSKQPTEHAEQVAFVARCRRENIFVFSIPNGVQINEDEDDKKFAKSQKYDKYAQINKLKAEGMVPGICDLFIPQYKLFIEMKRRDGGVVSESQKKVHCILKQLDYKVEVTNGAAVAWSVVERERKLEWYNMVRLKLWKMLLKHLSVIGLLLKKLSQP
jgi:hypothetical protein